MFWKTKEGGVCNPEIMELKRKVELLESRLWKVEINPEHKVRDRVEVVSVFSGDPYCGMIVKIHPDERYKCWNYDVLIDNTNRVMTLDETQLIPIE